MRSSCGPRKLLAAFLLLACLSHVSARLAVMSIDLGGEFMKIAIVKPGVPMETALNKDSGRKTLTMVAFRDGERQFSNQAQATFVKFPAKSISYLNHVIGRSFDDPQVDLYRSRFPYLDLVKDEERGTVLFKVEGATYSPEELLGMIIEKAREYAIDFAEQDIKDAVITVPSFYNQAERRAVLLAAELVGVNVLQLMNDNAAVALNYGVFRRKNFNTTTQYYMFYDMGATSTTATVVGYNVVKTKEGVYAETNPQLTVKGVGFDRTLGGLEFTLRLREHLAKTFDGQKKTSSKVRENNRSMAKLFKEAERVKKVLSANNDHAAQIEGLLDEKDFKAMVSRSELEGMSSDLFERVTKPVEEALRISEITMPEISEVILMGGATRMPKVQELLLKYLGRTELGKSINTDEAAAMGAVYQAAYLGKGFKVKKFGVRDGNVYPISVMFEKQKTEGDVVVEDNSPARLIKRTLFGRMNPFPQKKVMTFNRHTHDFGFKVIYTDLDFLSEDDKKSLGGQVVSEYKLKGVEQALTKNKDTESKGIKAHFRMDDSGLLTLERVESVFEKNATGDGEKSTWSKLGDAIGDFFGGNHDDKDSKVEESAEEGAEAGSEEDGKKTQEERKEDTAKEEEGEKAKKEEKEEENKKTEEQEKAGDDKKDKKEEGEKSDDKKTEDDKKESDKKEEKKTTGDDKKSSNATNTTKADTGPKIKVVKEEIASERSTLDVPDMSTDAVKAAKQRLSELRKLDTEKAELEKVKNELEAFIFDTQDKLGDDESAHYKCASQGEREKLVEALTQTSDWLYEQGEDTNTEDYRAKLKSLADSNKAIVRRVYEMDERPKALDALKNVLNQTKVFLETVRNMTDLEDPIFTPVELDTLHKLINESTEWRDKHVLEQSKLQPYEDPVMLTEDIAVKIGALDREMRYLINKAKNFKPKPKAKAKEESSNATKTSKDETSSDKTKTDSSQEEAPPTDQKEKEGEKKGEEGKKRRPKSKRKEEKKEEGVAEEILELDGGDTPAPSDKTDKEEKDKTEETTTEKSADEQHEEL